MESGANVTNKQYFNTISVKGLNFDDNGNIKVNGTTTIINRVTHNGIGVL